MKTDTGGSAFPRPLEGDEGMDLLDYYAGQAMKTILQVVFSSGGFSFTCDAERGEITGFDLRIPEETMNKMFDSAAELSGKQAKAMIVEKRRREEQ